MTIKELIDLIDNSSAEKEALEQNFKKCLNDKSFFNLDINPNNTKELILQIKDSKKTAFGNKLSILETICKEKEIAAQEFQAADYITSVSKMKNILNELIEIYNAAMKSEAETLAKAKAVKKTGLGDTSRIDKDVSALKADINRANAAISTINDEIKMQSQIFDSKVFQVLLNTVTLLGIFVAIAFAGFGTITIFTNIDIETWMTSKESFIKNTFILCITSLLAYNLLLILIYFIYKLSRPLTYMDQSEDSTKEREKTQNKLNLVPFLIIDIAMFILVVVLFFYCVCLSK